MNLNFITTKDIYIKAFKYITNTSQSNTLPYHNINHLLMVFNLAYQAGEYYKLKETNPGSEIELCLAALFHDVNHSGGKLPDNDNVKLSQEAASEFFKLYYSGKSKPEISLEKVLDNIKATQFPHEELELSFTQQLIRDCDLLTVLNDNYMFPVFYGLKEEFGTMSMKEQVKNQTQFTLKLKDDLNTNWAQSKFETKYGSLIHDLGLMTDIFKDNIYTQEYSNRKDFINKTTTKYHNLNENEKVIPNVSRKDLDTLGKS